MEDNSRPLIFGAMTFFAGLTIGLAAGVLLAPQSGERTRRQLHNMALDTQEDAEQAVKDAKDKIIEWVDKGKKVIGNS